MRPKPIGIGILLGALLVGGNVASAGTIEGSVLLTSADIGFRGGMKSNAYVGQLSGAAGNPGAAVPSDTTYGIAYVSDVGQAGDAPLPSVLLDQRGQRFIPRILAVVVGQTVEFRNSDNVFHNVFSYSPPKRFDLGRYPRGKSKRLTFQKPGLVQVFCDIHSDMRSDIVVVPSKRFAYVDASGRFKIEDVPSGKHTVVVWLPKRGERTGDIEVSESGSASFALSAE
jgi:plastocyanin